ncbi:DEAH (Asp-Glu-Ala-His) box polypeptide 34 [Rhizophlyctis rosea]|nr:DEAH (Asp-Glu-Ala-His) box polypeptide 34 [Rhizophlyctis rosea]
MTELRYNIDGTLREETEEEAVERIRPRRGQAWVRPARPSISKEELMAKAKAAILFRGKPMHIYEGEKPDVSRKTGEDLWGSEIDRVLFGRGGEAWFLRSSELYDKFKGFYAKYKLRVEKKRRAEYYDAVNERRHPPLPTENDLDVARYALALFEDFQAKKREKMKAEIEKTRAALPIKAFEEKIVETVRNNRVTLIAADTGAGKSTQVPQYLLAAGFDKIVCTQPRRIACYSLARRVSYESLDIYGSEIAYQVRFEGTKTSKTRILFLTEVTNDLGIVVAFEPSRDHSLQGVLLRQFASDPQLGQYNVIIVDEVHERHITGDFLLGVLKRLLQTRKDVHIILMSATINAKLFSEYFGAPIIEIPGRMFPVHIDYKPFYEDDRNLVDDRLFQERMDAEVRQSVPVTPHTLDAAPYLKFMRKVDEQIPLEQRGDLLVFLGGINDIMALSEALGEYANYTKRWIILMLHSSLSITEQEKVFDVAPAGVRKCILSTNIAETSVTIDNVRFIIDSEPNKTASVANEMINYMIIRVNELTGKVKEMGYDAAANLSRLSEFWISKSSAKQRAGRAGRTGPGQCIRLYSKEEYERLNEFPVPEILRMPLEPTLLQIRAYGLGDPREFDFIERPSEAQISFSIERLRDLGALDGSERVTSLGRVLAVLPLDVVLGKMLVLGSICDLVDPIIVIAAALSVQSPFLRVPESKTDIMENRRRIQSDHGDPFTLLNMFSEWLRVKAERKEQSRKWCRRHGIEEQRLYEMVMCLGLLGGVWLVFWGGGCYFVLVPVSAGAGDVGGAQVAGGGKRKRSGKDREDRDDPNYRKRKQQRQMLERQKRQQNSGKRKMLRLEDDMTINEGDAPPEDIADVSIEALEFELKHDAENLLKRSDAGNLTERDVALVKLVVCSGLYPHLAVTDDANHARKLQERVYHTTGKRFVQMHPTSVFAYKPELVEPKVSAPPQQREDGKETLATLHARTSVTDLLCYLELLETTKPYLTNVMRVPAVGSCLLFGRSIDISPNLRHIIVDEWLVLNFTDAALAERVLVLANWLRLAWDMVVNRKLENVKTGLSGGDAGGGGRVKYEMKKGSDWSDLKFVPAGVRRCRRDWEDAVVFGDGRGEFGEVEEEDVVAKLIEFLDIDVQFDVERLKMQDVSKMFGYEAYTPEILSDATVPAAPYLRYFVPNPNLGGNKMRSRVALPRVVEEKVEEEDVTMVEEGNGAPYVQFGTSMAGGVEEGKIVGEGSGGGGAGGEGSQEGVGQEEVVSVENGGPGGRSRFECPTCGKTMLFTPVEALKHRKGCRVGADT